MATINKQTIEIPEGFELIKVNDTEYKIVKVEKKLPKTWEEFCDKYPYTPENCWITNFGEIKDVGGYGPRSYEVSKNLLPNKEYAEAILALCQLIQLRDCYRQGWKPDYTNISETKYAIWYSGNVICCDNIFSGNEILSFQSEELRDMFLENFQDLIEKIKPLYC